MYDPNFILVRDGEYVWPLYVLVRFWVTNPVGINIPPKGKEHVKYDDSPRADKGTNPSTILFIATLRIDDSKYGKHY